MKMIQSAVTLRILLATTAMSHPRVDPGKETVSLIRYRIGREVACSFGQKLQESSFVKVVAVTPADEERA